MIYNSAEMTKKAIECWLTEDNENKKELRDQLAEVGLQVCELFTSKMPRTNDKSIIKSSANYAVVYSMNRYSPVLKYVDSGEEYVVKDKSEALKLFNEGIITNNIEFCTYLIQNFKYFCYRYRWDEMDRILTGQKFAYKKITNSLNNTDGNNTNNSDYEKKRRNIIPKRTLSLSDPTNIGNENDMEWGDFIASPNDSIDKIYKDIDSKSFLEIVRKKLNCMKTLNNICYAGLNMSIVINIFLIENGFSSQEQFKKVVGVYKNLDPLFTVLASQLFKDIKVLDLHMPLTSAEINKLKSFCERKYKQYISIDPNGPYGSRESILCSLVVTDILNAEGRNVKDLNNKESTMRKTGQIFGVTHQSIAQEVKRLLEYLGTSLQGVTTPNGNIIKS